MQQNKKIIVGIVVAIGVLIGGYFGYGYYLKYKKSAETVKDKMIEKELSREERIKEFTTVLPDANKIELTEKQKEFAKPIATSSSPTKTDPEREKLIKEFTHQQ